MESELEMLYEPCTALQSPDEVLNFLQDILTHGEIVKLAHRWQVMKHLAAGYTTTQVQEMTGASRTTIARAIQVVKRGTGVIEKIAKRLSENVTPEA